MLFYILKRLLAMIPTLFGIAFVTFLIINLAPGDPVATSMGAGGEKSAEGGGGQSRDRLADAIKAKKKLLGILAEDHSIVVWDAEKARATPVSAGEDRAAQPPELFLSGRLGELQGWPHTLVMAASGNTLYVGGDDKRIYGLDPTGAREARTFSGHTAAVWALALSPDGQVLVSADVDGAIRIWNTRTGETTASLEPLGKPVRDLAFLPDGKRFLSACDDGVVRMYDAAGKEQARFEGHVAGVYALAVARDGSRFWSGGYDRKLRVWSTGTNTLVATFGEHTQAINDLALSPDGGRLASACDDRGIRLFTLEPDGSSTAEPAKLEGHYKAVTAIAFSQDGEMLFSGSRDETIRSWDLKSGRVTTQSRETTGTVNALLVSPVGTTLWSASDSWIKVPIARRFLKWMARVATLDFDRSFMDDRPVIDKIGDALPVTIGLNALALLIVYLVAIPIGILSAVKRGSTLDHVSSLVLFVLYSIPNFWFATLLILTFSSKQNWDILPSVGVQPENPMDLSYLHWLGSVALHLVLPIIVLVYSGFASLSRYARTSMLETIGQDYIRTARAKGLPEKIVVYKHAFRNSLITIVTLVANLLPAMIGGSVIVEYIFSIHGMGKLGFDAILARDYPVIMAITTFSALLTLLGILLSDLLYSVVDPRITHS